MAATDRVSVLREQLDLTWRLAEIVLAGLTDEECLWLPARESWTVRRDEQGRWVADWEDDPPDDMAQPTLAWTMWQTIWWWTVVCDQAEGRGTPEREGIVWPGAAAGVEALQELHRRWDRVLVTQTADELDAGGAVTFPFDDGRPLIGIAGWANVELTKNIAEMGLLRRIRPTGHDRP